MQEALQFLDTLWIKDLKAWHPEAVDASIEQWRQWAEEDLPPVRNLSCFQDQRRRARIVFVLFAILGDEFPSFHQQVIDKAPYEISFQRDLAAWMLARGGARARWTFGSWLPQCCRVGLADVHSSHSEAKVRLLFELHDFINGLEETEHGSTEREAIASLQSRLHKEYLYLCHRRGNRREIPDAFPGPLLRQRDAMKALLDSYLDGLAQGHPIKTGETYDPDEAWLLYTRYTLTRDEPTSIQPWPIAYDIIVQRALPDSLPARYWESGPAFAVVKLFGLLPEQRQRQLLQSLIESGDPNMRLLPLYPPDLAAALCAEKLLVRPTRYQFELNVCDVLRHGEALGRPALLARAGKKKSPRYWALLQALRYWRKPTDVAIYIDAIRHFDRTNQHSQPLLWQALLGLWALREDGAVQSLLEGISAAPEKSETLCHALAICSYDRLDRWAPLIQEQAEHITQKTLRATLQAIAEGLASAPWDELACRAHVRYQRVCDLPDTDDPLAQGAKAFLDTETSKVFTRPDRGAWLELLDAHSADPCAAVFALWRLGGDPWASRDIRFQAAREKPRDIKPVVYKGLSAHSEAESLEYMDQVSAHLGDNWFAWIEARLTHSQHQRGVLLCKWYGAQDGCDVALLGQLLRSSTRPMRQQAALSLGAQGDAARQEIVEALQASKASIREAAAWALGQLHHPDATAMLERAIQKERAKGPKRALEQALEAQREAQRSQEHERGHTGIYSKAQLHDLNHAVLWLRQRLSAPLDLWGWVQLCDCIERLYQVDCADAFLGYAEEPLQWRTEDPKPTLPWGWKALSPTLKQFGGITQEGSWLTVSGLQQDSRCRSYFNAHIPDLERNARVRMLRWEQGKDMVDLILRAWAWCEEHTLPLNSLELFVDGGGVGHRRVSAKATRLALWHGFGVCLSRDKAIYGGNGRRVRVQLPKDHPARAEYGLSNRQRYLDLDPILDLKSR